MGKICEGCIRDFVTLVKSLEAMFNELTSEEVFWKGVDIERRIIDNFVGKLSERECISPAMHEVIKTNLDSLKAAIEKENREKALKIHMAIHDYLINYGVGHIAKKCQREKEL